MAEESGFMFLREMLKSKAKEKTRSTPDALNPILAGLSSTVEGNITKMRTITQETDTPVFMKNYYEDKGMLVPTELSGHEVEIDLIKKTSNKSSSETEKEILDAKKKPTKLLQKNLIKTLSSNIKTNVFGQDEVIDELVDVLKVTALNININKDKPAGCYFLAGPSGCGKTELAISLAKYLGTDEIPIPFLKLNMGEYGMENDVTKLIGAPPGYKGADDGGLLTNFVRENPICVVLMDETEKAHESMDKIMLAILDKGVCNDNKGRSISFKDTIIIATSNLGAEIEYESSYTKEQKNEYRMSMIKENLRPEIINRYDSIFHCNSISKDIYAKIFNKFLDKLIVSMKEEHQIDIKFSHKLLDWAVEASYDPAMGGRPARKFIEKIIIKPIADQMIDDKFDEINNKDITMDMNKDNNVVFKNKNKKILGILENTKELVGRMEEGKFTKKPKVKL